MLKSVVVLFAIVALSACKKSLELDPISDFATDKYFESAKQAEGALYGAYRRLQIATNQEFIYYGEGRTNNVVQGSKSPSSNTLSVLSNTLNGNLSYSRWDDYYSVIKQANLLIKNVPLMREKKIVISDADYNRVLGQAYALRALSYFYIVRIWGDAPLVLEPFGDITDLDILKTPRVDKNLLYDLIDADLKKALICPTSNGANEENRGMITRGAVYAIQTDYYMWRSDFDNALLASKNLVKETDGSPASSAYKLVELANTNANYSFGNTTIDESPYSKMFTQGLSDESIFEVVFSYDEDNNSNIFGIYGNNNAQFFANTEFSALFGNDLRAIATFKNDQIYKFFPKGTFDQSKENDKNVIIYRLADIMLLRAEALNAKNRRDEAFVLVNKIRVRAGQAPVTALAYNAYSTAEAEDYILDERRRELCYEGKRWFDLVRTGRVFTKLLDEAGLPKITDPNNVYWPISLDIIRENPLITQNEFYK